MNSPNTFPKYLTVADVASMLAVSEDTILNQFGSREGVIDIGTPATMHKRAKRALRIPLHAVHSFIEERQVKVRRRR
jgi:hypothetical protein